MITAKRSVWVSGRIQYFYTISVGIQMDLNAMNRKRIIWPNPIRIRCRFVFSYLVESDRIIRLGFRFYDLKKLNPVLQSHSAQSHANKID